MVLIKINKQLDEKYSSSIVDYWRKNPVIAANHLLKRDGEPLTLAPIQEIVLTEWWYSKFSLNTASRGMGKSFLAAVYASLQATLYPGTKIGIFAPAFRQSKLIFKEFTRLHAESPLLQEAVDKDPTQQNDQCLCIFKSTGRGLAPSEIKALPVGSDGGKIRGERFRKVILDEIPHMPEIIFRSSIQPMMSTAVNPMQKVKQLEKLKEQYGGIIPEDLILSDNGYIGITSGYYQFNYWWQEILNFYDQIKKGSKHYNLRFTPYLELPDGFYDVDTVTDAQINAPRHMFLTEWMAEWISDSDGAFPMSLLESCRDDKVIPKMGRDPDTDKGKKYVFGIDVARERDSTAVTVVELGYPSKLVFISELEQTRFQDQSKHIFDLIRRFNPVAIYMDEFGGGQTIRDHLADPSTVGYSVTETVITSDSAPNLRGSRILTLCNFNPVFIEDANNNTKTLLEQRAIKIPSASNPIDGHRKANLKGQSKEVDLVQELINQISSIVVTQTTTGKLHYDLPKGSTNSGKPKKKDLYTSFILACKCVYDLQWKHREVTPAVERGVIQEISPTQRNQVVSIDPTLTRSAGVDTMNGDSSKNVITIRGGGLILSNGKKKRY